MLATADDSLTETRAVPIFSVPGEVSRPVAWMLMSKIGSSASLLGRCRASVFTPGLFGLNCKLKVVVAPGLSVALPGRPTEKRPAWPVSLLLLSVPSVRDSLPVFLMVKIRFPELSTGTRPNSNVPPSAKLVPDASISISGDVRVIVSV